MREREAYILGLKPEVRRICCLRQTTERPIDLFSPSVNLTNDDRHH